ncbi:hypothetical protein IJ182_03650 [bacterium]|nr:hypothetical protein [bacterium]
MKNSAILFLTVIFSLTLLGANAAYVYENDNGEYQTDVDKFIPQSGVKVKTSKLADMMENSTRNAMEGNSGRTQHNQQQARKSNFMGQNQSNPNRRSYKWF